MRKRYERLRDSEGDRRDKELAVYGKRETHTDRHWDKKTERQIGKDRRTLRQIVRKRSRDSSEDRERQILRKRETDREIETETEKKRQ